MQQSTERQCSGPTRDATSQGSVPSGTAQLSSSDKALLQKRRLKVFKIEEKLAKLAAWKENGWSLTTAAEELDVPRGTLSGWRKQYSDKGLSAINEPPAISGRKRAKGAGRKHKMDDYEWEAIKFADQCANDGDTVTPASLLEHCKRYNDFAILNPHTQRTRVRRLIKRHKIATSTSESSRVDQDATTQPADDNESPATSDTRVQEAALSSSTASASATAGQSETTSLANPPQDASTTSTSTSTSAAAPGAVSFPSSSSSTSSSSSLIGTASTSTKTTTEGSGSASASAASGSKSQAASDSKSFTAVRRQKPQHEPAIIVNPRTSSREGLLALDDSWEDQALSEVDEGVATSSDDEEEEDEDDDPNRHWLSRKEAVTDDDDEDYDDDEEDFDDDEEDLDDEEDVNGNIRGGKIAQQKRKLSTTPQKKSKITTKPQKKSKTTTKPRQSKRVQTARADPVLLVMRSPAAVFAEELKESDLKSLEPGKRLTNTIINHVVQKTPHCELVFTLDSTIFLHIDSSYHAKDMKGAADAVSQVNWRAFRYVLLPIYSYNHWSLLVLETPLEENVVIYHVDCAMKIHDSVYICRVMKWFVTALHLSFQTKKSTIKFRDHTFHSLPLLKNRYDCGVRLLCSLNTIVGFINEHQPKTLADQQELFKTGLGPEQTATRRAKMLRSIKKRLEDMKPKNSNKKLPIKAGGASKATKAAKTSKTTKITARPKTNKGYQP